MAGIRRTEDELNFAAGLGRRKEADNRVIGSFGETYSRDSEDRPVKFAYDHSWLRPKEDVAGKVFDILVSLDETINNRLSQVFYDAKQKKLTLGNATLTHAHSQALFNIIKQNEIEYLDLSSSHNLRVSGILDFIAHDNNLHTVDLSNTKLSDAPSSHSRLPEKLGNLLSTNKTLKKIILDGVSNLWSDFCIEDPIANGIAKNDTLEVLDLSNTSLIGFNPARAPFFFDALTCNRSLATLKLPEPFKGIAQSRPDIYFAVVKTLNGIQAKIDINCERDSVELARQLVNYNSPIQDTSASAAAASNSLYKSISFLRHYGTSSEKLASLSHNLFKALHHINIQKDMISGLIPNIMSYAKDLFYSNHLFDILGVTKNISSQEHKSFGAKNSLYSVLEFLTFDDIKYQQIEAQSTPALEEVFMAGVDASADFEGKE